MKNRKCLVAAGLALLALVVVGLLSVREKATPGDAAARRVADGTESSPVTRRAAASPASPVTRRAAASPASPATQTPTKRGTLPFVLTSKAPFGKRLRLAAEALGARTVSSVSRQSILIEATPEARARLKADARFADVIEFAPSEKIQPELAALVEKGEKTVEVSILALDAVDRETVIAALTANGGEMLKGCINEGDTIRAKIPADAVAALAGRGEVRWMETFVRPKFVNDLAVKEPCMNIFYRVWTKFWALENICGEGQSISTSDTGIDSGDPATLHPDLRNRVKDMQVVSGCYTNDVNGHGTHTAGSIVGDGTNSPDPSNKIRGTAYKADLYAWFCNWPDGSVHTPDSVDTLYRNGGAWPASIHSASWGSAVNGQYISACYNHDKYVWEHPEFLPVFAAGNEGLGGATTMSSPGTAKNVLTVGATQSTRNGFDGGWGNGDPTKTAVFSSRGPCRDGRIKPDIAAPGVGILSTRSHGVKYDYGIEDEWYAYDSGTSMATPLTAGAVALTREWLMEEMHYDGTTEISPGVTNKLPTAALLKAVIMGGARGVSVPNNDQGWGRVDLAESLFPTNGRAVKLFDRIPFADGWVTNIVIETTNAAPLDVQLVWIDYPGSASGSQSTPRLVNDLDLTVEPYGIEGDFCYGNGGEEPDTLNNAESVRIATAAAGKYIITIDCKSILHDHTEGGAAALYIRGAFDPSANPEAPKCVHLEKLGEDFFGLDQALAAVRDDGEKVSIMRPTRLQKAVTIPTNCTLVAESADPAVVPVVRCAHRGLVTVPEDIAFTVSGVAFTNDFAGFSVEGTLAANNAIFENFAAVSVSTNGQATFGNVAVGGAAPTIVTETNSVVSLSGFTVAGAASDWSVAGSLALEGVRLADNQAVTVGPKGALTIGAGVTNLTAVTLEDATKDSLKLGAALVQSIEVSSPKAYAQGQVFGSYTCDYGIASASAALFVDVLDPEGELGGQANSADNTLCWAVVEAPEEAAGVRVDTGSGWKHYYGFKSALRAATNANSVVMLVKDSVWANVIALSHDLVLTSTNGADLTFLDDAQFAVPAGANLVLTNVTVSGVGAEHADCAFKVTGGTLTLEDGATLTDFTGMDRDNSKYWGGAIAVLSGSVTMQSGSRIENCTAHAAGGGGAIYVEAGATANLLGGTIDYCSAPRGGAVYGKGKAIVNVAGDFTATNNWSGSTDGGQVKFVSPQNVSFSSATPIFTLTGKLTGAVGVSFLRNTKPYPNTEGSNFVAVASNVDAADAMASARRFTNDLDDELVGTLSEDGEHIRWMRVYEDGTCEWNEASVLVEIDGLPDRYYPWIEDAFENVETNATFYFLGSPKSYPNYYLYAGEDRVTREIEVRHDIRFVGYSYWSFSLPRVWRADDAMIRILPGGSLTVENVAFSGAYGSAGSQYLLDDSTVGLFSVEGGSLTLGAYSYVGPVWGSASRAANAITVWEGGTLTMESGSQVFDGHNSFTNSITPEIGHGGAILLDRATAYFNGGTVSYSSAGSGGGVYVANNSKAYVSGNFTVTNNLDLSSERDNMVVSKNSELVLRDSFTGSIGVHEGVAGETNAFATVEWEWPSVDALKTAAALFYHDKSGARGTAVTNGDGRAVLVWSDWLSRAGKYVDSTGAVYRVCLAPGQVLAVPKAFSVAPTTAADGKQVLSLEGAEEGCWYTVYSTDDLSKPFTVEKSVQLKKGETFEYEIDRTKDAKFYKVVAEEGLK